MTNLDLISIIFSTSIVVISLALIERLHFARRFFRLKKPQNQYVKFEDLPTVSVCIPARNENETIKECLEKVLANDYPKMEIIVLDDDSVDNTSEMVRQFAHAGVRFIKGAKLPKGWIGKNHALMQLAAQATGSYIVFLSVDTEIPPDGISTMVRYALDNNLSMLSVMPRRPTLKWNVLFGSLRFFWEVILHSRNFPAISTSIWLVKADDLENYGNFWEIHRATIRPESSLANFFYDKRKYRFLTANDFIDISHEKPWMSQISTSIRTTGPVFDKSIWLKANVFAVLAIMVFGAGIAAVNLFFSQNIWIKALNIISLLLLANLHAFYAQISWKKGWFLALFTWPWTFLQELCVLAISIFYNKFHIVSWKGRRLPK